MNARTRLAKFSSWIWRRLLRPAIAVVSLVSVVGVALCFACLIRQLLANSEANTVVSSLLASAAAVVTIQDWSGLCRLVRAVMGLLTTIFDASLKSLGALLKDQVAHVSALSFSVMAYSLAIMTVVDQEPRPSNGEDLVQSALSRQGYTSELAHKLNRESGDRYFATEYYTARLPLSFVQADDGGLCNERSDIRPEDLTDADFGEGVRYDSDSNNGMVEKWVAALAPCASESEPVRLRVEGYARPTSSC